MSENEYGRSRRGGREYRGGRGYRGGGYHGGGSARRDDRSRRDYDDEPRDGILADLVGHLHALDGRSYAAYKATVGRYEAPEGWVLRIDRVQPDPYAPPTRIRLEIPADLPGLEILADRGLVGTVDRRLAVRDFLTRELHAGFKGTALSIASPGQEILERSAVVLLPDADPQEDGEDGEQAASAAAWTLEIRARMALPARGRSIQGHEAARIVSRDLTREVGTALDLTGRRAERLTAHVAALEDHRALARAVRENGWVSFLADGAELPRRSGVSDAPMRTGAVPLRAPEPLAAVVELPHAGRVRGTAIGSGVTVIVGGGYHGKSTLLAAIERGVYPHVPGDGRELVATVPDAVKVRAADGRAVTGVDLSPFISHLPGGRDTTAFTTKNASGSTSQAASIIEAIEAGASALLLDEDTSATNLLIRDARMRALVADEREPITPFVDRVGALSASGVSTVMVMGGSGDYLDVADRVVLMDSYALRDATTEAAAVAAAQPRVSTALSQWPTAGARVPLPSPPRDRRGPVRTRSRGLTQVTLDREDIDVADVSGIVDPGQTEAIAHALRALLEQRFDGESSLAQCLEDLDALLDDEGLDALGSAREHPAFLVRPRAVDVAGAVNRYRSLELA
ncbi:ABC-ATPase domain-containing protein [Actinomyces sp. oral taxon 448]|uniref:ABC-ATPase domain-containing protein n=1 Tax=Actinomyces sp. oral taxon 448 TaxID=712124 RepID=UPI00021892A3|nr:ABC-ATPase domain-containing protein [Actinomyces sp. oral taxon 448]EGQ72717.1 ATPase [Actinomyces sp. oral taxon 448 str. F0400]